MGNCGLVRETSSCLDGVKITGPVSLRCHFTPLGLKIPGATPKFISYQIASAPIQEEKSKPKSHHNIKESS